MVNLQHCDLVNSWLIIEANKETPTNIEENKEHLQQRMGMYIALRIEGILPRNPKPNPAGEPAGRADDRLMVSDTVDTQAHCTTSKKENRPCEEYVYVCVCAPVCVYIHSIYTYVNCIHIFFTFFCTSCICGEESHVYI